MDARTRGQVSLCTLVAVPVGAWLATAKAVYGWKPATFKAQMIYLIPHTFSLAPLKWALIGGIVLAILAVSVFVWASKTPFQGADYSVFYRGTRLTTAWRLAWRTRQRGAAQITIAGVPVPPKAETTHFAIGGATGTGKTTIFKEMILGCRRRGDKMVILDPNGEFLRTFGTPRDKILNPFDGRSQGWTFFNEIRNDYDFERFGLSVIPPTNSADSEEWNNYGRLLFQEVSRKLYAENRDPTMEQVFAWTNQRSSAELREFVRGTKAEALFTGADKATASARFVLSTKLAAHLVMPHGSFSLRDWIADDKGGNLFITWQEDQRAALRPLISAWTDIIFSTAIGLTENSKRRIWVYIDEIESLDRLPTYEDALTKGRKAGLCVVSGYQSYAQIEEVNGQNPAETILSSHRANVVLAAGAMGERTIERCSKALGEHEVMRRRINRSAGLSMNRGGGGSNISEEVRSERVVTPSEISRLRDLEGYLRFPGDLPVAKFSLKIVNYTRSKPMPALVPATLQERRSAADDAKPDPETGEIPMPAAG